MVTSMTSQETQSVEAHRHLARAAAALATSLWKFKMRPDYDTAATEFREAAQKFYSSGYFNDAISAYQREGEAYSENHDAFGAGRAFERGLDVALQCFKRFFRCDAQGVEAASAMPAEAESPATVSELSAVCEKLSAVAARCYQTAGKVETAARVLQKTVDVLEAGISEEGVATAIQNLFDMCLDILEVSDNTASPYYLDAIKAYAGILGRELLNMRHPGYRRENAGNEERQKTLTERLINLYEKCLQVQTQLQQPIQSCGNTLLCLAVLRLFRDLTQSEKPHDAVGWLERIVGAVPLSTTVNVTREVDIGRRLLSAWQSGSMGELDTLMTQSSALNYLPVEVARLAREVHKILAARQGEERVPAGAPGGPGPEDVGEWLT